MEDKELEKILKVTEEGDFALFDEINGAREDIKKISKEIVSKIEQKQNIKIDVSVIADAIKNSISKIKISTPTVSIPPVDTKGIEQAIKSGVKDIKIQVPIPNVIIPPINFPDKMVVDEVGLRGVSYDNPLPVQLRDSNGKPVSLIDNLTQIVNAGGGGSPRIVGIKEKIGPLKGVSANGTRALTLADTWYAVPSTIPTVDYVLVASVENSAGTIRFGFSNTGTPSATNGNLAPGHLEARLGAGQVIYFASSTAGDDVNWSTKEV